MNKIDRTGFVSGRLTVISEALSRVCGNKKRIYWLCKCECGKEITIVSDSIGLTKSCGCLKNEKIGALNYKHGEAKKTKENKAWFGMKSRCYNKNASKYPQYGGRGIIVCDRWLNSYEDFLSDIGRATTSKHSIDRIDVNGNYEPSNCRWATNKVQANNTTKNVFLTHKNERLTMKEWATKLNINYKSFHAAIKYQNKTLQHFIS